MSIYFTSRDNTGNVKALCGFKGVFVPTVKIADINSRAASLLSNGSIAPEVRLDALRELVSSEVFHATLAEELDHFRCVSHSRVAALMWFVNPLVRWHHLRGIRHLVHDVPSKSLSMPIIRFNLHCLGFMWRAYPIVEAAYLLQAPADPRHNGTTWDLQAERVHECMALLDEHGCREHEMLGRLMDHCCFAPNSDFWEVLQTVQAIGRPVSALQLATRHTNLLSPQLVRQLARVAFFYSRGTILRMNKRLLDRAPDDTNHDCGGTRKSQRLPQIMAADVSVDPAVLRYSLPKSRSASSKTTAAEKLLADVWWYLLQICSEMVFYVANGTCLETVLSHQEGILNFHRQWKVEEQLAMGDSDQFLFELLANTGLRFQRSIKASKSIAAHTQARCVWDLAFGVWERYARTLHELYRDRATGTGIRREAARRIALVANGSFIQI